VSRQNGDMAVFTDSGVTLFDISARAVTFDRTLLYSPGATGNAVYVDGVPIAGGAGVMLAGSGRLTGFAAVRDSATVTYQNQLDEIARGLIEAFAESDQSAVPSLPDAPGLFTYPGSPAMPASGTLLVGLAGSIRINPSVDPTQGGNLALLRDGGMAGDPAYVYNASGGSAYADRLNQYVTALSDARTFDSAAQISTGATLGGFASSSGAWLQEARRTANDDADYADTLLERTSEALSKETGINIDEEMTALLELERAYQASTRLITTIDNMLKSLLATAG
jgi:flagellar hook-associated protein 1 FlgK